MDREIESVCEPLDPQVTVTQTQSQTVPSTIMTTIAYTFPSPITFIDLKFSQMINVEFKEILEQLIDDITTNPPAKEDQMSNIEAVYLKHTQYFEKHHISLKDIHARVNRYGVKKTLHRLLRMVKRRERYL